MPPSKARRLKHRHNVALRVGNVLIEKWKDYSIECDMLSPADSFSLSFGPATRAMMKLLRIDAPVQVMLDDTVVLTGFIDSRKRKSSRGGSGITVTGRDKGGRLVDESMDLVSFSGMGIQQLAEAIAAPWFTKVSLLNTRNRALLRGAAAPKNRISSEPAIRDGVQRSERKVHPGQSRWTVFEDFAGEAGVIGWSSADGKEFIVGQPNYEQEPSYSFLLPKPKSPRRRWGNVIEYEHGDDVGERYSMVTVVASGSGKELAYADSVIRYRATAKNGPNADGTGKDFTARKQLIIDADDCKSPALTQKRAEQEMAQRDSHGLTLSLTVRGHAQQRDKNHRVLYAPDTTALVEDEEMGQSSIWFVTGVTHTHDRQSGETTSLRLVPLGTVLK